MIGMVFMPLEITLFAPGCSDMSLICGSDGGNMFKAGNAIGGLKTGLLVVAGALLIQLFVGKILALFLSATRQEISILDCGTCEAAYANSIDDREILEELLLYSHLDEGQDVSGDCYFERVDGQTENVISEGLFR
jgi:hypothetical protein